MSANDWAEALTEEQRTTLAAMDGDKIVDYLAAEGIELPDETLEGIAGGLPLSEILDNRLRDNLGPVGRR